MPKAGDVVVVNFTGATGVKRRPAVVLSSDLYHTQRPDVICGAITTNIPAATASTDHVLHDWQAAGLRRPSAVRAYFGMALQSDAQVIGRVSDRDWQAIQRCLHLALA